MRFILVILALLYVISPYDLLPDVLVGWGWVDDLIVLSLLWWYFSVLKKRRMSYESSFKNGGSTSGDRGAEGTSGSFEGDSSSREEESWKDPYGVLEIRKDATQEDIRQAYRRLASKYHPDKVSHLGEEFRALAEMRFKEIQAAYERLRAKE